MQGSASGRVTAQFADAGLLDELWRERTTHFRGGDVVLRCTPEYPEGQDPPG